MIILQRFKLVFPALIGLLLFLAGLPVQNGLANAQIPKLDQIRVALFIDGRGTVPSVSLSSDKGMTIGVRQPSGVHAWINQGGSASARFSADEFRIKWLETGDFNQARLSYNKLEDAGQQPYIFKQIHKGKPVFQVYTGQFASPEEAAKAAGTGISGYTPVVKGPLHWSAGVYNDENTANQHLQALQSAGLDGFIAVMENPQGQPIFAVWIGEASTQDQLNDVKNQALKALPTLALTAVDTASPYLLKRLDASLSSTGNDAISHFFFNVSGQKVWVSAAAGNGIKVSERYGRTYRGAIEITQYNGKLAVINQLPFEQYLYAVIGSELSANWPLEALKAQAVAARTYALTLGMKYKIAHISDSTYDQAYYGMGREFSQATAAVDQTKGEVLTNKDGLITPYYYSNSGGLSSDPLEIWGAPIDYIKSVPSPDQDAQNGKLPWDRIVLPDGSIGYIRTDFVQATGKTNPAGLDIVQVTENGVNVRTAPYVDNGSNPPIAQVNKGDQLIVFDQTIESNDFSWIRGPYTPDEMLRSINQRATVEIAGPLLTLSVTQRGASGRVMKMQDNGQDIQVSRPDNFRGAMNGLPSTRFDVEETGRYTILGANGVRRELPEQAGSSFIETGSATARLNGEKQLQPLQRSNLFFMNSRHKVRLATQQPQFRFIGLGNGHGLGMSQWGARALAELKYDYKYILQYYYKDVSIVKE